MVRTLALLLALTVAACEGGPVQRASLQAAVQVREAKGDPSIRFVGLAEARPSGNYFLRSWLDKMTGIVEHQLYVHEVFDQDWQYWASASDPDGNPLRMVYITKNQTSCAAGCDFGAELPDAALRAHPHGYSVTFHGRDGHDETVTLTARQIAAQLGAVDEKKAALHPPSP